MQRRPLTIITTRLPPQICGIGTFSWLLDRHWPGDTSQHHFLVVNDGKDSGEKSNRDVLDFGGEWSALNRALNDAGPADVLLHYAGRGYQRLGCPSGLPGVLRKWRSKFSDGRLIIFFHELPARLPLTNRHYWINLCSRSIARKLASMADLLITNTREHVQTLQTISGRRDIQCLPVSSNIEPAAIPGIARTRTEFVVFGLPYGRWQTLEAFDTKIRQWMTSNLMTKLHLIGPADEKFDARSETLIRTYSKPEAVVRHGELPPDGISELLSKVQFALSTADELTWSKSTTLMAFWAHGCAVVGTNRSTVEPLLWNVMPQEVESITDAELQARTEAGHRWYEANAAWKVLARKISDWIASLPRRDV